MLPAPSPPTNSRPQRRSHSSLNVYDVLFVIFKHKWKIIILSILGLAGAGAILFWNLHSPNYETEAKLLVRYVLERSAVDPYEAKVDASGAHGTSVMDAELEIIKSADLATEVAAKIGPEKILTEKSLSPTKMDAAIAISLNLDIKAERGSNVIHLKYHHSDATVAVAILKQLIDSYFEKHLALHRSTGTFETVARQTDQARSRLTQTEQELTKLNSESGFLSLADAKTALEARRNAVCSSLLGAQVELAEQQTKVSTLAASIGVIEPVTEIKQSDPEPPEETTSKRIARTKAQEKYRDLSEQLTLFKQKRNVLMVSRKQGDPMLLALDSQIESVQQQGLDLIEQYPSLARQSKVQGAPSTQTGGTDLNVERALLAAVEAKCKALTAQAKKADEDMERLSASAQAFTNLERRRQLEEEKYRYAETSLEKARVDEILKPANMPNIAVVQNPSAPVKAIAIASRRLALGLAASGIVSGLVLAFLIEWVIDRRVSRPMEIQTRLQLPLMMSIPRIRSKDGMAKLIGKEPGLKLLGDVADLSFPPEASSNNGDSQPQENEHFITPYASAIRDRIMFNFEFNNITHKPKLIGLTSLSRGAGTSTIAIAIAKAFAENGKFKVLLVDLNSSWSVALPASPVESLDTALEISRTDAFRKSPRSLYFAGAPTHRSSKGARSLASVAMHELMPQLEVSDFDYILFDMPPAGPTSPTIAIAGFMDKVLLVLDGENTNRESLSWSYAELEKGRADVSCVFNKSRSHAPRWVGGEA
ncbi:MAG: Wzz/FepE/Etk N-terminal domain-containing protein [Verrucomicrobiota bacterium]